MRVFSIHAVGLALTFAVLGAGAVVVVRQMTGRTSSGWVVLGPLLVFRFLFDLKK